VEIDMTLESYTLEHFGNWGHFVVWILIFGVFFFFLPYHKKSKTKPDKWYLAFIVASAFEMFGIPLSMYIIAWIFGVKAPVGFFWGHTLSTIFGFQSMNIGYLFNVMGGLLIIYGWKEIYAKYWGKTKNNQQLVTDGLYSFSRHPQYLGFILMTFGLLVHWATLPLLVMWPILVYRYYTLARKEEKEMIEEFGEAYSEYMKQTPMFLGLPKGSLVQSISSNLTKVDRFKFRTVGTASVLLFFYLLILTIGNSFSHAIQEIIKWWPFLTIQLLGLGLQTSMYLHVRDYNKTGVGNTKSSIAVSGGVSSSTMVACCLHHATDILPIIGFSAVPLFLSTYQFLFMSIGVLSNIIGVIIMLYYIQIDNTILGEKFSQVLVRFDLVKVRNITLVASIIIIAIISAYSIKLEPFSMAKRELIVVSDTRDGVTFSFQQIEDSAELAFLTNIDTHSKDLNFNLVDVVSLTYENQVILPDRWKAVLLVVIIDKVYCIFLISQLMKQR
jgi:methanethiol S-methyltransferase